MKVIDVHSHFVSPEYREYLKDNNGLLEDSMRLPDWNEDEMLAFMDRAGIEWTMLSVSSPHPYYREDAERGIRLCRQLNEYAAGLKAKYPDRIKFHAVVPLPDVDRAAEEAVYALDVLKADGIKLASNSRGQYLGDPAMEPLFEVLNQRKAIVNIHPHRPWPMNEDVFSARAIPLFEFFCDTTRAVLNMIANGVIEKYPEIRICVPHCGAFLPNIADRANGFLPLMNRLGLMDTVVHVKDNLKKLYYDTAGNPYPDLLPLLLTIAEPSHVMYGSDYPFTPGPMCEGNLKQFTEFLDSSEKLVPYKEMILRENARRLYQC